MAAAALTVALAGSGLTGTALAITTPRAGLAGPSQVTASRTAVVVKVHRTRHFGKVLFTVGDRALYYVSKGSCRGSCLSVWPPLMMPAGKTKPKGVSCLGTARFGPHHRLQVTYHGRRLYTFVDDTRGSIRGNGVSGFKVAKVTRCR
jgi:predicted lipoprotein with Yx(FWY)xxD motif